MQAVGALSALPQLTGPSTAFPIGAETTVPTSDGNGRGSANNLNTVITNSCSIHDNASTALDIVKVMRELCQLLAGSIAAHLYSSKDLVAATSNTFPLNN